MPDLSSLLASIGGPPSPSGAPAGPNPLATPQQAPSDPIGGLLRSLGINATQAVQAAAPLVLGGMGSDTLAGGRGRDTLGRPGGSYAPQRSGLVQAILGSGGQPSKALAPAKPDAGYNDHSTSDRWMSLLGGLSPALAPFAANVMASHRAQNAAHLSVQDRAQRASEADQLGLQGREREVFLLNPDEWSKQSASRYAASDLAGGTTRHVLGDSGDTYTAPKIEKFDDRFGAYDPATGQTAYGQPRDPTFAEQTDRNKPLNVQPGAHVVSPTGKEIYTAPDKVELHGFPATDNVYQLGGQAPAGSRGVRNNNPLNLTVLPHGQWEGQTGADGRFAVFGSPEAGFAAADKNLQSYAQNHGINTVAGIVSRWAPANENDTAKYIARVSGDLGVDPNKPIDLAKPENRAAVLRSMSKVELGGSPPAAPKLIQTAGAAPGAASLPPSVGNVTGKAVLDALPKAQALQVQALAEGRMQFPSGFALRSPYWQQMLQAVSQYDPGFDAVNYNARAKTRNDFTSGKGAGDIKALNTTIAHLGQLSRAVDNLGNNSYPINNKAANFIANATGDPRVKQFETDRNAAVAETVRVFRGSSGSASDIKEWTDKMSAADSPQQLHGVVRELARLLESRLKAVGEQYNKGMGTTSDPLTLLNPHAADVFRQLQGNGTMGQPPAAGRAPTKDPRKMTDDELRAQLGLH